MTGKRIKVQAGEPLLMIGCGPEGKSMNDKNGKVFVTFNECAGCSDSLDFPDKPGKPPTNKTATRMQVAVRDCAATKEVRRSWRHPARRAGR